MGRTRLPPPPPPPEQQQPPGSATATEKEVAAKIALALSTSSTAVASLATPAAIAALLLPLLPPALLAIPTLAARISFAAARLILRDYDKPSSARPASAVSAATGTAANQASLASQPKNLMEEALYRSLYGIEAQKRLAAAASGEEEGREERIAKAQRVEEVYFERHKEAARRRNVARTMTEVSVAAYGPVLSWHAVERPTSRPHHLAADKKNFDTTQGVPRETGALPGFLPNCLCTFGPPIPGAEVLR